MISTFVSKYHIHIITIHINMYKIFFHKFFRLSALLGFINIFMVWTMIKISMTNAVIPSIRFIIVYNSGMFLSAKIHVHMSQNVVAFQFNTSFCFQYTASTICFAQIIISIAIVVQAIISHHFFKPHPLVSVAIDIDFHTSIMNNHASTK